MTREEAATSERPAISTISSIPDGREANDVVVCGIRPRAGVYGATDNFAATVAFEDGSVGTLIYSSMGSTVAPKERMDVFADEALLQLDDYKSLSAAGASAKGLRTASSDKGQRSEIEALVRAIRDGSSWPIPLWQQLQATEIALDVQAALVARDR